MLICVCDLLTFDKSEAMTINKIAFYAFLFEFEAKIKGT
jgi:hypothetical protein